MDTHYLRAFIVILATVFLSTGLVVASDQETPVSPVAIVNGVPISQDSFDRQFSKYKEINEPPADDIADMQSDFLEGMIVKELLFQESQKRRVTIEKSDIDKIVANMKKEYDDEADFDKHLTGLNLTEQELKKELQYGLAVKALVYETIEKKISVSPEEARQFYEDNWESFNIKEKVRISHILVNVPPGADEKVKTEARLKIEKIRDRIKNGEDFAALAKEVSDCPSSANGGDLGFIGRGETTATIAAGDNPLEDTAFYLKPNKIAIIWTPFGYDLLKVTDRIERKIRYFDEVREEVNRQVVQSKMKAATDSYVAGLRDTAKIEKFIK